MPNEPGLVGSVDTEVLGDANRTVFVKLKNSARTCSLMLSRMANSLLNETSALRMPSVRSVAMYRGALPGFITWISKAIYVEHRGIAGAVQSIRGGLVVTDAAGELIAQNVGPLIAV